MLLRRLDRFNPIGIAVTKSGNRFCVHGRVADHAILYAHAVACAGRLACGRIYARRVVGQRDLRAGQRLAACHTDHAVNTRLQASRLTDDRFWAGEVTLGGNGFRGYRRIAQLTEVGVLALALTSGFTGRDRIGIDLVVAVEAD